MKNLFSPLPFIERKQFRIIGYDFGLNELDDKFFDAMFDETERFYDWKQNKAVIVFRAMIGC